MADKFDAIAAHLHALYSEADAEAALSEIARLIAAYTPRVQRSAHTLSQRDAVLITYGDQVRREGEAPLVTLKKFLDTFLHDLIDTVHILPFFPYSSDDGFSVIDYKAVDPKLGSWEDIAALSHAYRLMFDGVVNHMSRASEWVEGFLVGNPAYAHFFVETDLSVDLSQVVRPRTSPLLHAYVDANGKKRWLWTTFSEDQIDLNFANYRVLVAIFDVLLFYVEKGASLIRLDAIAFLWKAAGTPSIHLPQTHRIVQLMRLVLRQVQPDLLLVTETNVPHAENISYFGNGDNEADMVYNFALPPLLAHAMLTADTRKLTAWAQTLTLPSDRVCFFNFTASHDGCGLRPVADLLDAEEIAALVATVERRGGYVSYRETAEGEVAPYELNASYIDIVSDPVEPVALRVKKMLLTQAVMLAMPGVPGIYFHSLVGSTGDRAAVERSGNRRAINRQKFDYDLLKRELEREGLRREIYTGYIYLLRVRRRETLFDPFTPFAFPEIADGIFAIERRSHNGKKVLLALHNFTDKPILCNIRKSTGAEAVELLTQKPVTSERVTVPPYGVMWIKVKKENYENSKMPFPRGGVRYPFSAGYQGDAKRDAADSDQTVDSVRGRRGGRSGHGDDGDHHRARQAGDRRPLRHLVRTGASDQREFQRASAA